MSDLAIAWEYLTGYCVASHASHRKRAEWPPHPARVYMAMAAAWFESEPLDQEGSIQDEYKTEGAALRWLESLGDPEISLPLVEREFERECVDVFVPINDSAGPSAAILQSASTLTRDKQPRSFPRLFVGNDPCVLRWRDITNYESHRVALSRLCEKVTRIGHSTSLVSMWLASEDDNTFHEHERDTLVPETAATEVRTRTIPDGFLEILIERFGKASRDQHQSLSEQIEQLKASQKQIKGKGAKEAKLQIDEQVNGLASELARIVPKPVVRPSVSRWSGYRKLTSIENHTAAHSGFDTDILVLVRQSGLRLSAESTLMLTQTLRKTIMSACAEPLPDWISGHQPNGEPLRNGVGHLTCIPLLSAGFPYSDGHILGAGIVFPRTVSRHNRGVAMRSLLIDDDGMDKVVQLKFGRLGEWNLLRRDWTEERHALKPELWTAAPEGRDTWASVTPVVLDRFPKADRVKDRTKWTDEVIELVASACVNIGLPNPIDIDVDTTSWQTGAPRALQKHRPLRGDNSSSTIHAALGNGFPTYPAKNGSGAKPQIHVWLQFSQPIIGPLILGAGRYLGYGLCRPWSKAK